MSEEKKKKHKKKHKSKSKDYDFEVDASEIDRTVREAMKKVDKAMAQVKLAEGGPNRGMPDAAGAGEGDCNFTATNVTNTVHNHYGTYINIQGSKNIQVGNNNYMVVNQARKNSKTTKEVYDDFDDEDDYNVRRNARREGDIAKEEERVKDPSEMTEAERKVYDLTNSERLVNDEDFNIVCDNVGNWRRFFRLLGLDDPFLEQLQHDFHVDGVKEILHQGLLAWKQMMGKQATLGKLTNTLHRIGYTDTLQKFSV